MGVKTSPTNKDLKGIMMQQNMETMGEILLKMEQRAG
jgi:hypothetical protein